MPETIPANPPLSLPSWRHYFKAPAQMQTGGLKFLVDKLIPPGITFVGGPSGAGKTWVAVSLGKALFNKTKFLDYFAVSEQVPVLYLTPESGEAAFRQRLETLGLGAVKDGFLCRTLSDGPTLLNDNNLCSAVKDLKPVVFLDTAVRFSPATDENDALQNAKGLAAMCFHLLELGAPAIVPLHHSLKSLARPETEPDLENTLRGSGDLGAMADAVYCVKCSDIVHFRAEIHCVKARDFEPSDTFEVQGRPYINETGNLRLIRPPEMDPESFLSEEASKVAEVVTRSPKASARDIARELQISKNRVAPLARKAGFKKKDRLWVPIEDTGTVQ